MVDGPKERRAQPVRHAAGDLDAKRDGDDPRMIGRPLEVARDREASIREAVAGEEPPRVEAGAGREACHEKFGRGRAGVVTGRARLIDDHVVGPDPDPEAVEGLVPDLEVPHQMNSVTASFASSIAVIAPAGSSIPSMRSAFVRPIRSIVIWQGMSFTPSSIALESSSAGLAT